MSVPNLSEKVHIWIATIGGVTILLIGAAMSVRWVYVMAAMMGFWLYPVFVVPHSQGGGSL